MRTGHRGDLGRLLFWPATASWRGGLTDRCIGAIVHHMNTKRQSVTLSEPQVTYLQAEAERLGISVSDLIRRIIDQHRGA
jgi:Ribbon-helix-helix protein, copG family